MTGGGMPGQGTPRLRRAWAARITPLASRSVTTGLMLLVLLGSARAVQAHHRQTPPVVLFSGAETGSADGAFLHPNSARDGGLAAVIAPPGEADGSIVLYRSRGTTFDRVHIAPASGDTPGSTFGQPAVAAAGRVIAFVGNGPPGIGHQIDLFSRGMRFSPPGDPSGTSAAPTLSRNGRVLAFQSAGDLSHTGAISQQIYWYRVPGIPGGSFGNAQQASLGSGTSANASLDRSGKLIVFDSTTASLGDPDGLPGTSQIWSAVLPTGPVEVLTSGPGVSSHPQVSVEGRVVVFQSTSDLGGQPIGTLPAPQIFVLARQTGLMARLTGDQPDDAAGCTDPSIVPYRRDWRVAFLCNGNPYYALVMAGERYSVDAAQGPGASTVGVLAGLAPQFVLLSTTAHLLDSDPPQLGSGPQVYLLNLFKAENRVRRVAGPGYPLWFVAPGGA